MSFPNWLQNLRSARRAAGPHAITGDEARFEPRRIGSTSKPWKTAPTSAFGPASTTPPAHILMAWSQPTSTPTAIPTWPRPSTVASGNVSVLLGNGNGTFQAALNLRQRLGSRYLSLAGDFNGDGKLDLVTGDMDNDYGYIGVLLGNGDGTFQWVQEIGFGQNTTRAVAVAISTRRQTRLSRDRPHL